MLQPRCWYLAQQKGKNYSYQPLIKNKITYPKLQLTKTKNCFPPCSFRFLAKEKMLNINHSGGQKKRTSVHALFK